MPAISVPNLKAYMEMGLNIYISGLAGTGKTEGLKQAAKQAGYKLGYMSAPTLDAYVDLVGIPIAEHDETLGKKVLEFVRKKEFTDIEVLFIDELPRGELKTLNAVFEIIQFHTINGEKAMPNLKCVVAAGNPVDDDDYVGQNQLDAALLDRFDVYISTDSSISRPYFTEVFGDLVGNALTKWHSAHDHEQNGYISPRRMEKIGKAWTVMPKRSLLADMMPPSPNAKHDVGYLYELLQAAAEGKDSGAGIVNEIMGWGIKEIRNQREQILEELPKLNMEQIDMVTFEVAKALTGLDTETIVKDWSLVIEYMSSNTESGLIENWKTDKTAEFYIAKISNNIDRGSRRSDGK